MPVFVLRIQGRVQGVGYRAFCAREAQRLKINGTVRNCDDGSVELRCQVAHNELSTFIDVLNVGPPASHVKEILVQELVDHHLEHGFRILRN